MGKTLGIDRDTAKRIKRMNTKELDGYLTRVTDKSYSNGYEEGLMNGIAFVCAYVGGKDSGKGR